MITAEQLRNILNYDPLTGIFTWRRAGNGRRGIAGSATWDGYRRIEIRGRVYAAHRLAWLYVHGEWPASDLDHRDTVRDHNWIDNLRAATDSQNSCNRRRSTINSTGYKGVSYHRQQQRWQAQISKDGKTFYLGLFPSPEIAHEAYVDAAGKMFGEFARFA